MLFGGSFLLVALFVLNSTHKLFLSVITYTGLITIVGLSTGIPMSEVLKVAVISFVYMSLFFILLERVASKSSALWWSILVMGVVLWLLITYQLKTIWMTNVKWNHISYQRFSSSVRLSIINLNTLIKDLWWLNQLICFFIRN